MRPKVPSRHRAVPLAIAATIATGIAAAPPASAQTIPADAQTTCVVSAPEFATWFESGAPAANGVVKPANSVTFPNTPNCSFYKWSEQMFLWLTSPAPAAYGGGGGRIFDSQAFFDVSPPDASNKRTFIPHVNGVPIIFNVRAAQVGPRGLPVLMTRAGQLIEVRTVAPTQAALPTIRARTGASVAIARAEIGPAGKPLLFDRAGKVIDHVPAPLARVPAGAPISQIATIDKRIISGIPVFFNQQGQVVEVEQGQSDGGVLQARNGSLVYYATVVNDVYAYFATGTKNGGITPAPTQFPTTQAALNKVVTFASAHGKTFPDATALAIEVKASFIEAVNLPAGMEFITMKATIPTYDTSNPNHWVPNGQKSTTLALVGMHVVGSANGHPEMIWATFEHQRNAPVTAYTYNATSGPNPHTIAQDTSGAWLFAATNPAAPFNIMHMQQSGANIDAIAPNTISPSNTIRAKAWGAASNVNPNPLSNTAASNTEIISINTSVLGKLPAGDIRANYFMTGSTWTIGGAPPAGANEVGTSQLSNSTMETYQQGIDSTTTNGTANCFSCHTSNQVGVSHVFNALKPLF